MRRSTVAACAAGVVIAGGWATAGALNASAQPATVSAHHRPCDWHVWHKIDRYTSWRYVSPLLAQEFHVGACSKVISGTDSSVIFSQRGYVVEAS